MFLWLNICSLVWSRPDVRKRERKKSEVKGNRQREKEKGREEDFVTERVREGGRAKTRESGGERNKSETKHTHTERERDKTEREWQGNRSGSVGDRSQPLVQVCEPFHERLARSYFTLVLLSWYTCPVSTLQIQTGFNFHQWLPETETSAGWLSAMMEELSDGDKLHRLFPDPGCVFRVCNLSNQSTRNTWIYEVLIEPVIQTVISTRTRTQPDFLEMRRKCSGIWTNHGVCFLRQKQCLLGTGGAKITMNSEERSGQNIQDKIENCVSKMLLKQRTTDQTPIYWLHNQPNVLVWSNTSRKHFWVTNHWLLVHQNQ